MKRQRMKHEYSYKWDPVSPFAFKEDDWLKIKRSLITRRIPVSERVDWERRCDERRKNFEALCETALRFRHRAASDDFMTVKEAASKLSSIKRRAESLATELEASPLLLSNDAKYSLRASQAAAAELRAVMDLATARLLELKEKSTRSRHSNTDDFRIAFFTALGDEFVRSFNRNAGTPQRPTTQFKQFAKTIGSMIIGETSEHSVEGIYRRHLKNHFAAKKLITVKIAS